MPIIYLYIYVIKCTDEILLRCAPYGSVDGYQYLENRVFSRQDWS